jgi:hypothetical protein
MNIGRRRFIRASAISGPLTGYPVEERIFAPLAAAAALAGALPERKSRIV